MNQLHQHIEALVFCSEQSLGIDEIAASLKLSYGWELTEEEIRASLETIQEKYRGEGFAFELVEISEGFQFLTKKDFHPTINALIQHKAKKKLSVAQMETLAMIAYKQPISKSEIENVRGVNCDYAIQKLLEKDLITISGKSDGPGRPILYSTSESFMDYFGIKSVKDLPQLKDIHVESNEIGQPADSMEMDMSAQDEPNQQLDAPQDNPEVIVLEEEIMITADTESGAEAFPQTGDEPLETVVSEEVTDLSLPDRKQIFMENQENADEASEADHTIEGRTDID
jgi:segregation and condensation protein B